MIAVARADHERYEIARLNREVFDRPRLSPALLPCAMPLASRCRVAPRRSSSDQVTPLPHSGCACVTLRSTRKVAVTGLRQPTAARSVGDGCTATLCGFMLPGMRTCWSDELASSSGVSLRPQPLMKS